MILREREEGVRTRKSRFTEEQIAVALRQAEAGTPVPEIYWKLQITEGTFCSSPVSRSIWTLVRTASCSEPSNGNPSSHRPE